MNFKTPLCIPFWPRFQPSTELAKILIEIIIFIFYYKSINSFLCNHEVDYEKH